MMGDDESTGNGGNQDTEPQVPDYSDGVIKNLASDMMSTRGRMDQRRMVEAGGSEDQSGQDSLGDEHTDSTTVMDFSDTVVKRREQPDQKKMVEGHQEERAEEDK